MHHGDFHTRHGLGSTFIHRGNLLDAFFLQPRTKFKNTDRRGAVLPADLDRVANVIAVSVGADQHVRLLHVLFIFRTLRIAPDPGIYIKHLPFRSLDAKCCMAQPR